MGGDPVWSAPSLACPSTSVAKCAFDWAAIKVPGACMSQSAPLAAASCLSSLLVDPPHSVLLKPFVLPICTHTHPRTQPHPPTTQRSFFSPSLTSLSQSFSFLLLSVIFSFINSRHSLVNSIRRISYSFCSRLAPISRNCSLVLISLIRPFLHANIQR